MTVDYTVRRVCLSLLLAALAASACQKSDQPAVLAAPAKTQASSADADAVDPAVADATKRMAAGVPMGASTAPVDVRFALARAPSAGQPFDVEVAVLPQAPAPVLHIDVRPGDGLSVDALDGPATVEKVQAGTLERLIIKASSPKPGTRVLGVKVTLELPGGAEAREFAFPLIVGPAASPPPANRGG